LFVEEKVGKIQVSRVSTGGQEGQQVEEEQFVWGSKVDPVATIASLVVREVQSVSLVPRQVKQVRQTGQQVLR
jgi:hypothetical protein